MAYILTDLFTSIVFVPVLSIVDIIEIPASWEESSQPGLGDSIDVVTIAAPDLNYCVWFNLQGWDGKEIWIKDDEVENL